MPAELNVLLRARYPLIWLDTTEEERAVDLITRAAAQLGDPVAGWSLTLGIHEVPGQPRRGAHADPMDVLEQIREGRRQLWILKDFGAACQGADGARVTRALREATHACRLKGAVIVCVGHGWELPRVLEGEAVVHGLALPDRSEHTQRLFKVAAELKRPLDPGTADALAHACVGLTLDQAQSVWSRIHAVGGRLSRDDVGQVLAEKARIVKASGALELVPPASLAELGGMGALAEWIRQRALGFTPRARDAGLPWPRALLLVGVPGCGASLVARALAGEWRQPLLRVGGATLGAGSEGQLRRALAVAERVAPAVLWIDGLDGGARGGIDEGAAGRMRGLLSSWLQERPSPVFVVATSHEVSALSPELTRRGLFDEVFFLDLPNEAQRRAIWEIHLAERARLGRDPGLGARLDLDALARQSDGHSGGEIAAAVVEAAFQCLAADRPLDGASLSRALAASPPMARLRAEEINSLRAWARGRARSAE